MKRRRTIENESQSIQNIADPNMLPKALSAFRMPWRLIGFAYLVCSSRGDEIAVPTLTQTPVTLPSLAPTSLPPTLAPITMSPTLVPTLSPTVSSYPTISSQPSGQPSFATIRSKATFRQDFRLESPCDVEFCTFNETQVQTLLDILESYTPMLGVDTSRVTTECKFEAQNNEEKVDEKNETKSIKITALDYHCVYESNYVDVEGYPDALGALINNQDSDPTFLKRLQEAQLPVQQADLARVRIIQTPSPTGSKEPSASPTHFPTISARPSRSPSAAPSRTPTMEPTDSDIGFITKMPTAMEPERSGIRLNVLIPVVSVVGVLVVMSALFLLVYRSWIKTSRSLPRYNTPNSGNSYGPWTGENSDGDMTDRNVVLSPTESLLSNKSLLSKGESGVGEDSCEENDGTRNLQDEFDQFKDQNLETLRANVEGNLTGFEGIMSQAVTNALMGDEDTHVDTQELLWGCDPNPSGTEIEASALSEVSDWLKRNEGAGSERKRAFMQEILNKMVTSVRFGVLRAEVASRTIHESAAILGLQLAEELPTTTVVISGMRKTTTANDMIRALREFGDIDVAAVASGRRGFGIVRFRRQKSVDRALRRYRSGEIVILDVSIQMKVIESVTANEN